MVPPLGLAYLASVVERAGFRTYIVDMNPVQMHCKDVELILRKFRPSVLAISFMTNQFGAAMRIAREAKASFPKIPVIVGGNHVSALAREVLSCPEIDFVAIGEGEGIFLEWLQRWFGGDHHWEDLLGLGYKSNGAVVLNPPRPFIQNLDELPFPKWDDFHLEAYTEKIVGVEEELPVFSMITSRGCPANCTFCASSVVWKRKIRQRSAENLLAEMNYLEQRFGAKHYNILDDTFTVNKQRVERFCELLIMGQKDYRWLVNARVNTVTPEMLKMMYQAGCRNICFGVEAGDDAVRKRMGKGITRQAILDAHRWAKDAGLVVSSFFMVGNPGEDWKSIHQTIELAHKLDTDLPSCTIATPFPGTPFFNEAERNGWLLSKNWDDYITTPHVKMKYKPVTTNGILSAEEILQAYYLVNRVFLMKKLTARYGKLFWLSSSFYRKEILERVKKMGLMNLFRLGKKVLWKAT